jgi:hypothetical protein
MTDTDQKLKTRWEAFTEDEREVSHFAFTSAAKRILDDAAADKIPADTLNSAAGTFLHLSNLSRQLDLAAGRPTENLDSAVVVAQLIASGETPEAVKYAAEVDPPSGEAL